MADLNYTKADNNTLISRLYALRAGLSVCNEEATIIKAEQKKIDDLRNEEAIEYRKVEGEISYTERNLSDAEKNILSAKHNIEESYDHLSYWRKRIVKIYIIFFGLILSFLILCALSFLKWNNSLLGIGFFSASVVCLICLFTNRDFRYYSKGIKDNIQMIANEKKTLRGYMDWKTKATTKLEDLNNNKAEKNEKIKRKYVQLIKPHQDKINLHLLAGQIFYEKVSIQFKNLIDRRDWKYVDYLIFCLETGRADTLKEALKFADEENRTRRLENAIEQAKNSIVNTINSRFNSLQSVMVSEFTSLRSSINSAIASMSSQINTKMSSLQSSVNSRLSEISSAQYVSNSLMKNIAYNTYVMANSCDYLNARNPAYY